MSQLGSDYISMESLGQSQPGGLVMAPDGNYLYSPDGADVGWSRTTDGGYVMMPTGTGTGQAATPTTTLPTANNPMVGENGQYNFLGADLNPQYYGKYMDQLPANMPGGGGAIIDNYGAAPFVRNWNTGSAILNGPFANQGFNQNYYLSQNPDVAAAVKNGDFTSALQHYQMYGKAEGRLPNSGAGNSWQPGANTPWATPQGNGSGWGQPGGYYQPYQMISGGSNYGIPPIGTGPFSFNQGGSYYGNPYQNAAQGSDLNISDAFNNARWDQYQDYTTANPGSPGRGTMIGGKEYNFAAPWQDSSTGSPFAGAQQAQGNSAGWTSGDTGPNTNQFTGNSFQVDGGQSVTGNAAAPQDPGQMWNRDLMKMFRRYGHMQDRMGSDPRGGQRFMQHITDRYNSRMPGFSDLYNQYGDWYSQNAGLLNNRNLYRRDYLNQNPISMGMDLSGYQMPTSRGGMMPPPPGAPRSPNIWRV